MWRENSMIRRYIYRCVFIWGLLCLTLAATCATDVHMRIAAQFTNPRPIPGEPIVLKCILTNDTPQPALVQMPGLNESWLSVTGLWRNKQPIPVRHGDGGSERPSVAPIIRLEPNGETTLTFVLSRLLPQ